jgi:predicted dehydrogenase
MMSASTTAEEKEDRATRVSRRSFVKTAAAAALAAPTIVPASVFGADAPSNRIALGCIGVGNQGSAILHKFMQFGDCQIVAICDVNRGSHGYRDDKQFLGRDPVKKLVEDHYGQSRRGGDFQGCDTHHDFRELLARDDIDAVTICTPDHWHSIMTIRAAEAGKDIYCEKPLSLTIGDGRAMVNAVKKQDRVLQTGSHHRSAPAMQRAVELVRNGYLGEVRRVVTHVARNNMVGPGPGWKAMPVPDGFDYAMWLGPAPLAPYHADRCLYRFRFNYDYSGGQVTNFGAHSNDIAQWGLGMDEGGPVQVESVYADFPPEGSLFDTAEYSHYRCMYANGVVLECQTAEPGMRIVFEGSEGVLRVDSMGENLETFPESLKTKDLGANDIRLGGSSDHQRGFLDAVKSRREPIASAEVGHRSATVCHLGNIAMRLRVGPLTWDPKAEQFTGRHADAANAMVHRDVREPWNV